MMLVDVVEANYAVRLQRYPVPSQWEIALDNGRIAA
jgi:hypothetical protein